MVRALAATIESFLGEHSSDLRLPIINQTYLEIIHDSSEKTDKRKAFDFDDLMCRNDQLSLALLSFPDQLAKKTDTFKILTKSPQKLSLFNHFVKLVFRLFDDFWTEGLLFLLLLLLLAVVGVLLRRHWGAVRPCCFGELKILKYKISEIDYKCNVGSRNLITVGQRNNLTLSRRLSCSIK